MDPLFPELGAGLLHAQTFIEALVSQLNEQVRRRRELLRKLADIPLEEPRATGNLTYTLTPRQELVRELGAVAPRIESISKSLTQYCETAQWEHFK